MKERYILSIFYLLTGALALLIAPDYAKAGIRAFENPSEISNSFYYLLMILFFTFLVILLAKFRKDLLKVVFYFLIFLTYIYAFMPFLGILSMFPSVILLSLLILKRHWIVLNISGLLIASAITAIFGISFEPYPAIILLVILAIYDYIAVYKTKHMIRLAESVSDINVPVLFIIPRKDRKAIMGVGDAVIPNILAVSSYVFNHCLIQSVLVIIFGYIGLITLMIFVERKGGAHAGLPFLNTGAITGYLSGFLFCH
uniref:Presenilin n=1 Tax=Geoglobus ahangari TaxID=113653 RepID=A0A7C3UCT1_9EURY